MRRATLVMILFLLSGCAPWRVIVINDRHGAEKQNDLGVVWLKQGETDLALRKFTKAALIAPDWSLPHVNAGNAHAINESWAEAEQSYRRALGIDPQNLDATNNLAVALALQDRLEEAEIWAEKAVALKPDPRCLDTLAQIRIALGKYEEAADAVEKALASSPAERLRHTLLAKKTHLDAILTLFKTPPDTNKSN